MVRHSVDYRADESRFGVADRYGLVKTVMSFSTDNPNKNRNYIIAILAAVVVFAIVMAGYVSLSIADRDTDAYIRFLTVLVVTLIPTTLGAWNSYKAQKHAGAAEENTRQVAKQLNGTLTDTVRDAAHEGTSNAIKEVTEDGRPSV